MSSSTSIRPKDRDAILLSLRTGVVPRLGQHLIQVGRTREIQAILNDIIRLGDGGSAFRLIIGEYGAGKSFFLNLVRSIAFEKKIVVASADLNPDRRLHGSGGQARSLYAELMRRISTRAKPDGGALPGIVEKFIATSNSEARASKVEVEEVIYSKLEHLTELVNGYDFAKVIHCYCRGVEEGNEQLKADAIRWLRGEFSTKTEARASLGVRGIVDDASVYDQLKLMAQFVQEAGYSGMIVSLDEMVNLYKISNTQARNGNYEQVLRILNDTLQGASGGLGFLLAGTPEFLIDTRRGLYSYPALQGRLAENTFAQDGLVDFTGPVIRLSSLSPEEFYLLLSKVRHVHASGNPEKYLISDEGIKQFMIYCSKRIGDTYFRTPRTTIKSFADLLALLEQNPDSSWETIIGQISIELDIETDLNTGTDGENDFASFRL
jgi:hypothetical protein